MHDEAAYILTQRRRAIHHAASPNFTIKWPLICIVQLVDRSAFINAPRERNIPLKI